MADSGPLIVPIEVQAMVVNNANMNFVRAGMNYRQLENFMSPSPAPFQNDAGSGFAANPANQGVYLMWTLPKALRHGQQNSTGGLDFPFVPNRWLVVRVYRPAVGPNVVPPAQTPAVAAWVVQSDFLDETRGTSTFLDPRTTQTTPTLIGRKVSISSTAPWQEPTNPTPYFLRAVTESNPAFAAYQPFNQNVFSIFDDLVTQQIDSGTISYFVLGWFSQGSADTLSGWQSGVAGKDFPDLLNQLRWTATKSASQSTKSSLYQGAAFGVSWQRGGSAPPSPKEGVFPQVAMGNTSVDGVVTFARAAFEKADTRRGGLTPQQAADTLEAFQYNMLPMMDLPGAEAMLEQRIRNQWYGSVHAETTWTIVDAQTPSGTTPPPPPTDADLAREAAWLSPLNTAQKAFDQAARELIGVQRDLFELWWKKGAAYSYYQQTFMDWPWTIESSEQFDSGMAPLITRARALITQLKTLASQIPTATDKVTLSEAIVNFAKSMNLPATRILKAVAGARFWSPGDPVAVISNTAHLLKIDPDNDIACRWPTEVVSQLTVSASTDNTAGPQFTISSSQLAQFLPVIPWANLPNLSQALFTEFFLLDPANARLVAAGASQNLNAAQLKAVAASMSPPKVANGQAPDILSTYPWTQAWQPVYLDWAVQWFPIPFQKSDGTLNWEFNGLDYDLVKDRPAPASTPIMLSGRSVLTPKPSFEFKARIDQYIRDYPDSEATRELKAIEDLVATVDGWDFLSQSFGGLQTQISSWNPVPTMNPDTTPLPGGNTLAELIGNQAQMPPLPTSYDTPRDPTVPPSTFEGMRGGQLYVNRLTIVDAFGQTLEIVFAPTASDQFPRTAKKEVFHPLLSDGLAPTKPLSTAEPLRFVQLPPRVLQPARLNFKFLPQLNDDPIVGWILPNHLDSGLAVYDRAGTAYGELTLGVNQQNLPVVNWIAAPDSPFPVLPAPAPGQGHLLRFLSNLKNQGTKAFVDFLQAVDETLWTIDPLGNRSDTFLSVLIGRPLAVVQASVALELQSDPWTDPDWPYTFATPQPDPLFLKYKFPVRLGDLGYRQDGLIGYFLNNDYSHFNTIHLPERGEKDPPLSEYLKPIGTGNYLNLGFAEKGPGTPATLTMIMDPRGSVHAQCGFLPVKEVSLLPEWVDSALKVLDVTFRTGPVLVGEQQVLTQGQTQPVTSLLLTSPAEKHGTWSWLQSDGKGHWPETSLAPVDSTATFPNVPPTLREGMIKLTGGLDE
jgi:hypothetical protein